MSQVVDALVGLWAGSVSYGTTVEKFTIALDTDGSAHLNTAETGGHGTWQMTGEDTFVFTITERLHEGDSGVSGDTEVTGIDHLIINIDAKLFGTAFVGTGTAEVFDAAGAVIFSIAAETTAQLAPAQ
ncbi:hypothetical protein [Actinacidiphila paucisporea]|uniref:Uncharacterized protein n=1 Tax=Actinacidiphila paucisporea TaxID=310782 RepID=A0A1M7QYB4_9ACTN|nr:hypothetical protein [Actinacidiphila paucisporea]SHN37153.1 hypothetical protein SAMN05216499_1505 [Actinacidiphila paucisporea]